MTRNELGELPRDLTAYVGITRDQIGSDFDTFEDTYPTLDLSDTDEAVPPQFDLNNLGLEVTEAVDLLRKEELAD